MAKLKPCPFCDGEAEFITEYIETAFGDRKCVAIRCAGCKKRTSLYMGQGDPDTIKIIVDLWNRGRIGGAEDGK
jgi:hypothetical protein